MKATIQFETNSMLSPMSQEKILNSKQYELLDFETEFTILVNDKVFFNEPNFSVYELLQQILLWVNNDDNFYYNSLETDENPLISFCKVNDKYVIESPWQNFECKEQFTKEQLLSILDLVI